MVAIAGQKFKQNCGVPGLAGHDERIVGHPLVTPLPRCDVPVAAPAAVPHAKRDTSCPESSYRYRGDFGTPVKVAFFRHDKSCTTNVSSARSCVPGLTSPWPGCGTGLSPFEGDFSSRHAACVFPRNCCWRSPVFPVLPLIPKLFHFTIILNTVNILQKKYWRSFSARLA